MNWDVMKRHIDGRHGNPPAFEGIIRRRRQLLELIGSVAALTDVMNVARKSGQSQMLSAAILTPGNRRDHRNGESYGARPQKSVAQAEGGAWC